MHRPAIALCVLFVSGDAAAQGDPSQEIFEQGLAAFQVRDFDAALERFRRAYILSRRPEFLFNIGLTQERLGRREDAVATLQQFISLQPTSPQRPDAERRISVLHALPPVAAAPPVATVSLVATVSPRLPGPPPTVRVPPAAPVRSPRPAWAWVTLGVGVASGVAGAALLASVSDPGGDPAVLTEAQYLDATDGVGTQRVAGAVLLAAGGVAIVTGVIGLVAGRPAREGRGLQVYAWPLRGGGVAGVSLTAF